MINRPFKMHTVQLLAHKAASAWSCVCMPGICNTIPPGLIVSKDATWDSKRYTGLVQCLQAIDKLRRNCLLHTAHVYLTYACISLWSLSPKSVLHPVMQHEFLGGLKVIQNAYNTFTDIQNIIYHMLGMHAWRMHVFCSDIFPPSLLCIQWCIAGF